MGCEFLQTWERMFKFHNIRISYLKAEKLLACQEGFYSMELVISMFHLRQMGEYK